MLILDAHEDIAYNAVCFDRDYRARVADTRRREAGSPVTARNGTALLGLPDALAGQVALVFGTLFVAPKTNRPSPWDHLSYTEPQEAYRLASAQMDYYERLADESESFTLIRTESELDALLQAWQTRQAAPPAEADEADPTPATPPPSVGQQGLVVLMENADPIIEPKQFEQWYERGVRIVGPAWKRTRYCGGTGDPGPLTDLGRELLEVLAGFGVLLDLSHMAEAAYMEALDRYEGPVIASHSNPRQFRDSDRHLSDPMIHGLVERDGVMGIVLYNLFLSNDWDGKTRLPLTIVADAIDYVCQLTGSAAHVGIGTDFDGGFGLESVPAGLNTIADLGKIADLLAERGYAAADITAVMHGNMLRKLREALPA